MIFIILGATVAPAISVKCQKLTAGVRGLHFIDISPQYIIKERHRCHEIYDSEIVVLHHRECSLDGTNLFG